MAKQKKALGRGLSAILSNPSTDITQSEDGYEASTPLGAIGELPIDTIEVNPFQPRTHFNQEALQELSLSIKELGVIQPVTVRKLGYDKYQLISGERRFRASQLAGLTKIPAYIRVANDQEMLEMALIENIQRENLDAIEIALSYQLLMDECQLTQEKLGNAKFMHCLPVRRNVVVEDAVLDSDQSVVIAQSNNRTYAAQLVLKKILENG